MGSTSVLHDVRLEFWMLVFRKEERRLKSAADSLYSREHCTDGSRWVQLEVATVEIIFPGKNEA
jgi:hypothetical protein